MRRLFGNLLRKTSLYPFVKAQKENMYARFPANRKLLDKRKKFYSTFIESGDLCFDLGANVGNRVEVFLTLGAQVVALEPQPMCASVLRNRFRTGNFEVVEKAVGAAIGESELFLSTAHTISSLSEDWIKSIETRHPEHHWNQKVVVGVTTLDQLVAEYGEPSFCKIDVEGYELDVLLGLSCSLKAISFEFTIPECNQQAIDCVERLVGLGFKTYNYSFEETMVLESEAPMTGEKLIVTLREIEAKGEMRWGDIYAFSGSA